jgi:hypothetical protein
MAVNIKDASNATVPIASATLGSDQVQQIGWAMATRTDTYTGAANGTSVNVSTLGMTRFGIQVIYSGGVTVHDVVLEGSLDGTNFTTILQHSSALGNVNGETIWTGPVTFPVLYFRSRGITRTGGTNFAATIIGMP